MKATELKTKTREELTGLSQTKRAELARVKFRHAMGQLEKTAELKKMRREIARIETLIREKALEKGSNAKAN